MAAHLGTGIQLAAVGPQNDFLEGREGRDATPGDTTKPERVGRSLFAHVTTRSSRFAAETREVLPLQTPAFGRKATFELAHNADMLGDMHVQITLPAVQPLLGSLPPVPLPDSLGDIVSLVSQLPAFARGSLAMQGFLGIGMRYTVEPGLGTLWTYQSGGATWRVAAYVSGLVHSTLVGAPTPRTLTVTTGRGATTLEQAPGTTLALFVTEDGAVVAANDAWKSPAAYVLMRRARLVVDDLVLHDHERLWYDLTDRLTARAGHRAGMEELLGTGLSMGREHTVILPLKFLCCATSYRDRTYLPTALLPNARVRVELELEDFAACVTGTSVPAPPPAPEVVLVVENVTLEREERNAMLLQGATLMYESAQDMDAVNYSEGAVDGAGTPIKTPQLAVNLSELNLPVRALVWVVYDEAVPDLFTYVDAAAEVALQFGSVERTKALGEWYARQQRWSHARRCEAGADVGMYSFALEPWAPDPSGALDFSLVQKPVLRVVLRPEVAQRQLKCKVFGVTYNWLTFKDGRVTRAFSD